MRFWRISLKDIIDIKEWQNIQDNFSSVTGVSLRIVDESGKAITRPSGESRLCNELIKASAFKDTICGECLPTFLGGKQKVNKNLDFVCLPGLHNFVSPLTLENGKVVGYLLLGPMFFISRNPKDDYKNTSEELKIDIEKLWDALLEIKVLSFHNAQSLLKLISGVAKFTLKYAYQNLKRKKEVEMQLDPSQLDKVLDTLLEVAFQVSKADIGSIMFFDKDNDILSIKSSRGIPEDIVKDTKVRLGEGISGMVAQENRPLILNDTVSNKQIKNRLNRPQLKSSIVLPIKTEEKVLGVMNLGVLRSSSTDFDLQHLQLMNKLIDLATITLNPPKATPIT